MLEEEPTLGRQGLRAEKHASHGQENVDHIHSSEGTGEIHAGRALPEEERADIPA